MGQTRGGKDMKTILKRELKISSASAEVESWRRQGKQSLQSKAIKTLWKELGHCSEEAEAAAKPVLKRNHSIPIDIMDTITEVPDFKETERRRLPTSEDSCNPLIVV